MDDQILVDIYEQRRLADIKRQPDCKSFLEQLHAALLSLEPPRYHPYELSPDDFETLKDLPAYQAICLGTRSTVSTDYLYRISTWPKFVSDIAASTRSWRLIPRSVSESEAFTYLMDEHFRVGPWIPVSRFIGGNYSGMRGFTWWTTTVMPSLNMMCTAHEMGLLNSDIGPEILILRCPCHFIRDHTRCHVPSVVDGYFFNIFHATQYTEPSPYGRCISVESPINLTLGAEEIVMRPLDIDRAGIEVRPLMLNDPAAHKVYFNDVSEGLIRYYTSLVESTGE